MPQSATLAEQSAGPSPFAADPGARWARLIAVPEARWAGIAVALFLAGLVAQFSGGPSWLWWALYLACYLAGGWEPGLAGLRALREKTLDVDLLMVVAALGAAAIGQVLDGALLIVIFATSGALEALATARTEDSVRGLLDLAPDTTTRLDPDGGERTVALVDLEVGDVVLARPGERIPADGKVISGASEVNQAAITGEPLPADKTAGDAVLAGTLNGTGALRIRVARRAGESVVARIAGLVEQASRTKARTQLFIEKVEQHYSLGMVIATLAIFALPLLWGTGVRESLLRAMTFMIVASPCAVVLATMPPLLAVIANAGRHGVLVKSAVALERLGSTTRVAFDKTGTLTRGVPELTGLHVLPAAGTSADALLRVAAAAEYPSEHPLASAMRAAARARGLELPTAENFQAHPGRGISARVEGRLVEIGAPHALLPEGSPTARAAVDAVRQRGDTAVIMLCDRHPVAVLAITDPIRPEATPTIAALTRLTGVAPVLLTGDNHTTASHIARQAGITDIRAGLLPEDKVSAVRELETGQHRVTVVGDGINDAPALAAAHTGIAMGRAGSDLTLHTADAIIIRDDLTTIPTLITLARRARRVVTANLVIAAAFITGLVLWDLFGTLPLPLGVAGHEGSTILVGLNGLRLLRDTAWRRASNPA
ncbi:heavy metal translocating P-type ATPase [Pseudonocardia eucalypti]|uniref:Heavy metal translocating P-type ATPase n=1 Tax=Pseudonocardia eucalypti TaxID=648755 RepID=A0ABP9PJI6_9PSEU|nr:heavy metal translocating P-type ATPase [Pseudonocardia eucalypti]